MNEQKLSGRFIDENGQVVMTVSGLFDFIEQGHSIDGLVAENTPETQAYNSHSSNQLKLYDPDNQPSQKDFDQKNISEWFTPPPFDSIDLEEYLESKCKNQEQIKRVKLELNMYEERNLIPLLRHLIYLVDHFRKNDTVWGVGRGSSVSSYVLYLIGIHKVDSLKYGLEITDFLR